MLLKGTFLENQPFFFTHHTSHFYVDKKKS